MLDVVRTSSVWGSLFKSYPLFVLINQALSLFIIAIVADKGSSRDQAYIKKR